MSDNVSDNESDETARSLTTQRWKGSDDFVLDEHVEIGKQSPLKQEWKKFLKSSSLFVRNRSD